MALSPTYAAPKPIVDRIGKTLEAALATVDGLAAMIHRAVSLRQTFARHAKG